MNMEPQRVGQRVRIDRRTIDAFTAYMTKPSAANFGRVLSTPGAELAYAHHKWSSVTSRKAIDAFWREELGRIRWSKRMASSIQENDNYLKARRKAWIDAVLEYLPRGHIMNSKVYLIGGYDSVVWGEDVALNLANIKFVKDSREAVYYLVHELAHAGYFRYRCMPDLAGLGTRRELVEAVKLLTHLEGMGVLSPLKLRVKEGGLSDGDYRVLMDQGETKARVREYFEMLRRLEREPDRGIRESDYGILDYFSARPKRLWYIAGCYMAMKIEGRFGTSALKDMVGRGHGAFFRAYAEIEDPLSL